MLVFVTKYLILRFSQVIMLVCTLGAHAEPEPQKYHSSYAAEYPPTHYSKPYSEPAYESYPEKHPAVYHEKYPTTYPEKYPAPYHEKYHASYPEKYPSYPEKYPAAYPEKYPAAYPEKYPTAYQPKPTVYPYSTPIKYCDPKAAPKCAENTTNTVCLTDDEYPTYEIKVTQSVFFINISVLTIIQKYIAWTIKSKAFQRYPSTHTSFIYGSCYHSMPSTTILWS